jgi:hypothetical protein
VGIADFTLFIIFISFARFFLRGGFRQTTLFGDAHHRVPSFKNATHKHAGTEVYRIASSEWFTGSVLPTCADSPNAPFDRPFYLILQLAVGGMWAGDGLCSQW